MFMREAIFANLNSDGSVAPVLDKVNESVARLEKFIKCMKKSQKDIIRRCIWIYL